VFHEGNRETMKNEEKKKHKSVYYLV